jgi:hypothetical protein
VAEYQRAEFIGLSMLPARVVVGEILLQSLEELPLAILLVFRTETDRRG